MQGLLATILENASKAPSPLAMPAWTWLLLVAAAGVACITDLRAMRIPNWLTLPLLAAGLAHSGISGGWSGLLHSLGASAFAGSIFVIGYAFFRGGAGDAKLMLAIGSWVSIDLSMVIVMSVTIVGFLQAMLMVVIRGGVQDIPLAVFDSWSRVYLAARGARRGRFAWREDDSAEIEAAPKARHKGWFPYAPAILLGTVGAWWYTVKHGGLG